MTSLILLRTGLHSEVIHQLDEPPLFVFRILGGAHQWDLPASLPAQALQDARVWKLR